MGREAGLGPSPLPTTAVFGAAGFIGRHVLAALRRANRDTVGVAKAPGDGLSCLDLAKPDIAALGLKGKGVTRAVIAAAVSGVAECERDPAATRAVNVEGTVELARQLCGEGIRVIALSSDYVFDGVAGDYDEESSVNPVNEYGRQKADMEARLIRTCGGSVLIPRLGKVYDATRGSGTLLDEMAARLLRGERVQAARDQLFCPTFVDDVANVVCALLTTEMSGVLHLCAPAKTSRFDLAQRVAREFGCDERRIEGISLRDLPETFARPLDTSMVCRRLARFMEGGFRGVPECLAELKSAYGKA